MDYSFKQWCEDNNREDILNRWDYEKTGFGPEDISYGSEKLVWLYCERNIHESESHHIDQLHKGNGEKGVKCRKCNSFAQYVIDNYGDDYLDKIWSKNNIISPWDISAKSKKEILVIKDGIDKKTTAQSVLRPKGRRSPNDNTVVKEKSLGELYPKVFSVWSDKNKSTPYDFWPNSDEEVWWECENKIHEDYLRRISSSKVRDFYCPTCGRLGAGLIDLTGNTYGELTVIGYDKSVDNIPYWWVKCSCNKVVSMRGVVLREGMAKTCGDGIHYTGENNPNWKGGEKTENQRIRSSGPYRRWRDAVVDKYGIVSPITLLPIIDPELHHIYPMSTNPDLMFEEWNTMILDKKFHSMRINSGFHYQFGSKNNTPKQLEEFINKTRKLYGINIPFNIENYLLDMKEKAKNNPIPKPIIKF